MKIGDVQHFIDMMPEGERTLRRLLWLNHGHIGLYGDDGEMQCGQCGIDFVRFSVPEIDAAFEQRGMHALRAHFEAVDYEGKPFND